VRRLQALAADHPRSGLVALHLGLAFYWSHRDAEAFRAWRAAEELQPDSLYAVRAGDLLHPRFAPGLPAFVPTFELPATNRLEPLARAAATGGARAHIVYGVALQRLDRPRSAEKQFAAAAAEAPNDAEARVAAAVGRFDKDNPSRAFSRLGPLVRVFPRAQTVRFHLGLLLIWIGQVRQAREELRRARADGPRTVLGRQAAQYLNVLKTVGTR
jgi:tetratricopeptide (TPR) repeat protein